MFNFEHGQDLWNQNQDMLTKQILEILRIFKDAFVEFPIIFQSVDRGYDKRRDEKIKFPKSMQACASVCGRFEKLTCMDLKMMSHDWNE